MYIDYRALNIQTVRDHYRLVWIDLLLGRLVQASVSSRLDMAQGYHQIDMAEDCIS